MKVTFACPSCAAAGRVDDHLVGREVRCRHCKARFLIPGPGGADADVYAIDDSNPPPAEAPIDEPESAPTFVSKRGDEDTTFVSKRKPRPAAARPRPREVDRSETRVPWAAGLAIAAIALVIALGVVALVVPGGSVMVACVLMGIGSLLVLVGYAAGGYGAFREDFLYGFLYLVIPFYTAYYVATRWEDLWPWFACSTTGVGLVLLGTEVLRLSGAIP